MKHKRILMSVAMAALVLVSLCAVGASALSVGAAQGSSTNVQAPNVVGAPVGPGAPAVCSADSGVTLNLFVRGADNYLYQKVGTVSSGVWTWAPAISPNLGGALTSPPAATSRNPGGITVFARGNDGGIWYRDYVNGAWGKWVSIGGAVAANTGPTVCSWGSGRLDVFVQGTNSGMYQKTWTDQKGWSGWSYRGGVLTSAPAATATSDGGNQIGVFVRGNDGGVWYMHYSDASSWGSWTSVGGQVYAGTSPAAFNWGATQIGWFVTGVNQHLYYKWARFTPGGQTSGYADLGGYLTSSPGATSKTTGTIDVFARGGSGDFTILWQKSYDGLWYVGGWSDWTSITFP